ncbi:MAG: radical SAM protein [Candidatus Omnitrophota bacterium]
MKVKDKFLCLAAIVKCRVFGKAIPLAVRLQLTNRCTLQCKYCKLWQTESKELNTAEVFSLLDELAKLGTKRISFSGGEPLLREDIAEIFRYAGTKGMYSEMNCNGTLVSRNIEKLTDLDFLKLSLDGPPEVHDFLRGKGSYEKVIEAADICKKKGIRFGFATTLTKYNIDKLDEILAIAKKYETIAAFQPIKKLYRGISDISELSPGEKEFKIAIERLIITKRSGNKNIRNSLRGLQHIYDWPRYEKLRCWAGKIFCIIEANGDVMPCDRISYNSKLPNCLEPDMKQAWAILPAVVCSGCGFCGSLELNYLMSFKPGILGSIRKILG